MGLPMKRCPKCENEYPASPEYFSRHRGHRDGLGTYCKKCEAIRIMTRRISAESARNNSSSEASTKIVVQHIPRGPREFSSGTPDMCGSCGTKRGNIFGDVNSETREKYGYLCGKCYKLAKEVQKDISRVRSVLSYLELTRHNQVQ